MSLEEVITAARRLSQREQQQLIEALRQRAEAGGDGAQPDASAPTEQEALAAYREKLAAAAQPYWEGVDGLEYQMRIRAEWDDRPGWDE